MGSSAVRVGEGQTVVGDHVLEHLVCGVGGSGRGNLEGSAGGDLYGQGDVAAGGGDVVSELVLERIDD